MIVYFSTVIRSAPTDRGGELVKLDWERKRVLASVTIAPENPTLIDPNPRGNTRGGRGIQLVGDQVLVCSFHTMRFFDRDLTPRRDVTHPLLVSLHETALDGDGIWLTSTAIDAALRFDLKGGELTRAVWPRDDERLQRSFGLTPLEIDKQADNRGLFLGSEHYQHPHHVHLNAVAMHDGRLLGLFSKFGAIVDLDHGQTLVTHKSLKGAHNLVVDKGGVATCCHSLGRAVLRFDLSTGARIAKLGFGDAKTVRSLARRHDATYALRKALARARLIGHTPPRPVFVRGLARHHDGWLVGVSPATILRVDDHGRVTDHFTYSQDVNACVHGLTIEP